MILSFRCAETEKVFNRIFSRKLPQDIQRIAFRKLRMLNQSTSLNDLKVPPSNHLEVLKKNRQGQWSIRINNQWRVCFIWKDDNAYEVEIVDYH